MVQELKKGDRVTINGDMKGTFVGKIGNMCSVDTDIYLSITTDCKKIRKITE